MQVVPFAFFLVLFVVSVQGSIDDKTKGSGSPAIINYNYDGGTRPQTYPSLPVSLMPPLAVPEAEDRHYHWLKKKFKKGKKKFLKKKKKYHHKCGGSKFDPFQIFNYFKSFHGDDHDEEHDDGGNIRIEIPYGALHDDYRRRRFDSIRTRVVPSTRRPWRLRKPPGVVRREKLFIPLSTSTADHVKKINYSQPDFSLFGGSYNSINSISPSSGTTLAGSVSGRNSSVEKVVTVTPSSVWAYSPIFITRHQRNFTGSDRYYSDKWVPMAVPNNKTGSFASTANHA